MPLQLKPLDPSQLPPAAARAVSGPGPAKMMAARGLMPMGPRDLVAVLYQLALDADEKIAEAASKTAENLPENILLAALGDPLDPMILDFFARRVVTQEQPIERILLNKAVHDETLIFLGGKLAERELEILAGNQERILKCPKIIEAIYFNQHARMSTVKLLLELAVRHDLALDVPQYKEIKASIMGELEAAAAQPADPVAAQMAALEADVMDEAYSRAVSEGSEQVGDMEYEAEEVADPSKVGWFDRPFVEQLRLAGTGTAMHRAVYIKSPNKVVAMAVIQSPLVTDQEAARFASNRALNEDIIRYIAYKKEWHKNYILKVALINNPKCPVPVAIHLLSHLRANDLRALSRSKNVPAAVAAAARDMVSRRK